MSTFGGHLRDGARKEQNRTKPMRVLVLGMCRTGTSSICVALDKLGYKVFHMNENVKRPREFFPLWYQAMDAKFNGKGKPFEPKDFDQILAEYDGVSDLPAALFSDELIAAYPDAKVVLTTRDPQKWVESMQGSLWLIASWRFWDIMAPFSSMTRLWRAGELLEYDAFIGQRGRRDYQSREYAKLAEKRYREHNEHVRKITPKEKLLEHRPQDGWKPLCEFLGHEVPNEEYPHVWDKDQLLKFAGIHWWITLAMTLGQTVLPVAVVAGAVYWQRHNLSF